MFIYNYIKVLNCKSLHLKLLIIEILKEISYSPLKIPLCVHRWSFGSTCTYIPVCVLHDKTYLGIVKPIQLVVNTGLVFE